MRSSQPVIGLSGEIQAQSVYFSLEENCELFLSVLEQRAQVSTTIVHSSFCGTKREYKEYASDANFVSIVTTALTPQKHLDNAHRHLQLRGCILWLSNCNCFGLRFILPIGYYSFCCCYKHLMSSKNKAIH